MARLFVMVSEGSDETQQPSVIIFICKVHLYKVVTAAATSCQ